MRLALTLHPDSRCEAVKTIEVDVERPRGRTLELRYRLTGAMGALILPPPASPQRVDGLWRHTCLEAFVCAPDSEGYYEFNLSPSTQWAAYRFTGYRSGMSDAVGIAPPRIGTRSDAGRLEVLASLDLEPLADLPGDQPWRLGLSAVIEEAAGRTSYWALAHPPGTADFHHADCFAGEVLAPGQP